MANDIVKLPVAVAYLDHGQELQPASPVVLRNLLPGDGEIEVRTDTLIFLSIFSLDGKVLDGQTKIWITAGGVRALAFDETIGGPQPGYDGSRSGFISFPSPGSAVNDTQRIILHPTAALASGVVVVEVEYGSSTARLGQTYSFVVADTTAPTVSDVRFIDPWRAVVQLSKPMEFPESNEDISDEIIGYGDGVTTSFVYNTRHAPIKHGSLEIQTEDASGNPIVVVDDGKGGFLGDYDPTKDVILDYATGEVSFTFLAPPANNDLVRVTYKIFPQVKDPDPDQVLFHRQLTGGVEIKDSSTIKINETPSSSWVGLHVGIENSAYPENNHYFKITAIDTTKNQLTVSPSTLKADDGIDTSPDGNLRVKRTISCTLSCFKLTSYATSETDSDGNPIVAVGYEPVIEKIERVPKDFILSTDDSSRYVLLTLSQPISFGRSYGLSLWNAVDYLGTAATGGEHRFTSPSFGLPTDRFRLWDHTLSEVDRGTDYNKELEKFCAVAQDVLDILYYQAQNLWFLRDPDFAPVSVLDHLLHALGDIFPIPLTENQKRRLALKLVSAYKLGGTEKGIEELLAFFLGFNVDVRPYLTIDSWVLGTSKLGTETLLGPGTAFARNSYEIVAYQPLTQEQRDIIRIIATTIDPANMHLVRIREHTLGTPLPLIYWTLGSSALGYSTTLAPA